MGSRHLWPNFWGVRDPNHPPVQVPAVGGRGPQPPTGAGARGAAMPIFSPIMLSHLNILKTNILNFDRQILELGCQIILQA